MNTKTKSNRRSLDAIADDIRKLERDRMAALFEIGDLLIEAREACEHHGEWYSWLSEHFAMSPDTAENYMRAARMPRTVRVMRLANTTFYALAKMDADLLSATLDALAKAGAAKAHIKPADANRVMHLVRLRHKYGDGLPNATLEALDIWTNKPSEFREVIVKALYAAKPTTKADAETIISKASEAAMQEAMKQRPAPIQPREAPHPPLAEPEHAGDAEREGFGSDGLLDGELAEAEPPPGWSAQSGNGQRPGDGELYSLLKAILVNHARRSPPTMLTKSDLSGRDLCEIANYVYALHRDRQGGDKAKIAADKAEAQSRAK
jgi:hypothetical protein